MLSADTTKVRLGEITNYNFPDISYLAKFEPPQWVFDGLDPLHDGRHAAATQIAGNLWIETAEFLDLAPYRSLINHALVLHDSGRRRIHNDRITPMNDPHHGVRGAEIAHELLRDHLTASELHIVTELIKGHAPGGTFDSTLDPRLLQLIKLADKSQLIRAERINPGIIVKAKLSSPLIEEIFFPLHDLLYARVDEIADMLSVNGYRAMLLSGVEQRIVNPNER